MNDPLFKKCNRCGEDIKIWDSLYDDDGNEIEYVYNDALNVKQIWGCFSEHDEEKHEFTLCEKCYDAILSEFKILAQITYYM